MLKKISLIISMIFIIAGILIMILPGLPNISGLAVILIGIVSFIFIKVAK